MPYKWKAQLYATGPRVRMGTEQTSQSMCVCIPYNNK